MNGVTEQILIDLPNGSLNGTSSLSPYVPISPITLQTPIVLDPGDSFELIWYPYEAATDFNLIANAFYIGDNSNPIGGVPVLVRGVIRDASSVSPVTNLVYNRGCASEGSLSWSNPIDMSNKQVLVFAKKATNIDQGAPYQDPVTYGTPNNGSIPITRSMPTDVQYENDPLPPCWYIVEQEVQ